MIAPSGPSELHRVVRRYAHDGKLIDLLGGLQAAIGRIDAVLARHAPEEPDASPGSLASRALPAPPGSREWTDAVLGAIAIRDHLARALLAAAGAAGADPEVEHVRQGSLQESLLR